MEPTEIESAKGSVELVQIMDRSPDSNISLTSNNVLNLSWCCIQNRSGISLAVPLILIRSVPTNPGPMALVPATRKEQSVSYVLSPR